MQREEGGRKHLRLEHGGYLGHARRGGEGGAGCVEDVCAVFVVLGIAALLYITIVSLAGRISAARVGARGGGAEGRYTGVGTVVGGRFE